MRGECVRVCVEGHVRVNYWYICVYRCNGVDLNVRKVMSRCGGCCRLGQVKGGEGERDTGKKECVQVCQDAKS